MLKIKDLLPDEANFNTGTEFGNSLIDKSLSKFGAGRSILIDKNNRIIAGNKTIENAAANGFDDIVIVETTGEQIVAVKRTDIDLNTKKGREMALADNATAKANISWDAQTLTEWDMPLQEWGIDLTDITEVEPAGDADAEPQIDKAAELNKKWGVVSGDLWQIGEHRLLCGDSTKELPATSAICITSPPYNVGKNATLSSHQDNGSKYLHDMDDKTDDEYLSLLSLVTQNALAVCDFVFINIQSVANNKTALIEYLYAFRDSYADTLIWDKQNAQPAMAENVLNSRFEYVHCFSHKANRAIGTKPFRGTLSNVLTLDSHKDKEYADMHSATYPLEFAAHFIRNFCNEGETVFEPFAGSGTTLVACQNLNRKCYAIEISENYCAVILQRMSDAFPDLLIEKVS